MKFADKLFFAMAAVLTTIFMVFGAWMLSSYFDKTLEREMEQADTESRMYQYLFEMTYQSVLEYGEDSAIQNAADSVAASMEEDESRYFAWSDREIYYGDEVQGIKQSEVLRQLAQTLGEENTYACGIRQLGEYYYLLNVCQTDTWEHTVYLGISKDITKIYEDRQALVDQYRLAVMGLLLIGGVCIYILSRYITRPIRRLDAVVEEIAGGNYERRSQYRSQDEIGTLSAHFNEMADRLLQQMQEKEQEAQQKEREAEQKRQEAQRQEQFTAAFAHELKTPLTSIIGYAELLNAVPLSEEERSEAYYFIFRQGKRLENLSHKLLELVSLDQTSLQIRPVPTMELEEAMRKTMGPLWEQKRIQGTFSMEEGQIYGDKDLMLSVCYNLLDNAGKAVEEGGQICVKGRCLDGGYELRITDNGRGIPPQEIPRITEPFYMVDKSRSRKEGGAGIGMALCQKILSFHQATMSIDSAVGEGTVISLFFPEHKEVAR